MLTIKPLGQVKPVASTPTTLYQVPASTEATVSLLVISNLGTVDEVGTLAVRAGGATLTDAHIMLPTIVVPAGEPLVFSFGLGLSANSILEVTSYGNLVFQAYGTERT